MTRTAERDRQAEESFRLGLDDACVNDVGPGVATLPTISPTNCDSVRRRFNSSTSGLHQVDRSTCEHQRGGHARHGASVPARERHTDDRCPDDAPESRPEQSTARRTEAKTPVPHSNREQEVLSRLQPELAEGWIGHGPQSASGPTRRTPCTGVPRPPARRHRASPAVQLNLHRSFCGPVRDGSRNDPDPEARVARISPRNPGGDRRGRVRSLGRGGGGGRGSR